MNINARERKMKRKTAEENSLHLPILNTECAENVRMVHGCVTWTTVQSAMALHRMAENAFRFIFLFALLFFSLFIVFFCVCLSFHPWLLIPLDLQHDNILNICCITLPRYVNWNALEGKLLIALTCTHKVDSVYLPFLFVCACTFSRFISFSFEIRVYFPCPSAVATNTAARSYVGILQNLCLWLTPWIILTYICTLSVMLLIFRPNQSKTILTIETACVICRFAMDAEISMVIKRQTTTNKRHPRTMENGFNNLINVCTAKWRSRFKIDLRRHPWKGEPSWWLIVDCWCNRFNAD